MELAVIAEGMVAMEPSEVAISELQVLEESVQIKDMDCKEESVNLYEIPLTALRHATSVNIANELNNEKLFLTQDKKYNRDWRGLVDILSLPRPGQTSDKAGQVLRAWEKVEGASLGALIDCLDTIERWDIVDDNIDQINDDADNFIRRRRIEDITNNNDDELDMLISNKVLTFEDKRRYLNREPLIKYNSIIIYAQADDDENFAVQMQTKLIETANNEAERHVCLKLDILPGLMEKDAILGLIAERCSYVIVIITPNYGLESPENKFLVNFAQSYSIDQNRRVIIPCIYGGTDVPLPKELKYLSKLDYNRERSMPGYNFWGRLRTSIDTSKADSPDDESDECRKLRLINALPMRDLYEAMKERELRRGEDGARLIELVESEGKSYHANHLQKVIDKAGRPPDKAEFSPFKARSRIPTPAETVTKVCSKFYKMFIKKKPKKGSPSTTDVLDENIDADDDMSEQKSL